ncbi:MAG: holo-ACP synthase [Candidatus Gastranaerophilales bacterium]|nr:holo-ACP synthase [Candidatus Gastranaerophilales bacterium]
MISNGIDIEDISRFEGKTLENDLKFLSRIFTQNELDYCFSFSKPAPHLAARYCAKEATVKALSNIYNGTIGYSKIEVLKNSNGSVYINMLIDELKKYNYSLSISHEKEKAVASVIVEY